MTFSSEPPGRLRELARTWPGTNVNERAIRQARAAAGLTQSELAKRIGVTQQQVANIESPGGDIRLGTLERAADALELTIDLRLRPRAA